MPKKIKKQQISNQSDTLSVNQDERSSRFVIDLKQDLAKKELEDNQTANESKDNKVFERILEFDFKRAWSKFAVIFKEKTALKPLVEHSKELKKSFSKKILPLANIKAISEFKDKIGNEKINDSARTNEKQNSLIYKWWINKKYKHKLEQLMFFGLFEFLFLLFLKIIKFFYKSCYFIGWLFLFAIRFLGLSLSWLYKFILPATNKSKNGLKFIFQFIGVNISGGVKIVTSQGISLLSVAKGKTKLFFQMFIKAKSEKKDKNNQEEVMSEKDVADNIKAEKNDDIQESAIDKLPKTNIFKPKKLLLRPILSFSILLLLLILPFKAFTYYKSLDLAGLKGKVLGTSEVAINDLLIASKSAIELDFNQASSDFTKAGEHFFDAKEQLDNINSIFFILAKFAPSQDIKMASESKRILTAGELIASLGNNLSLAFSSIFNNQNENILDIVDNFILHGEKAVVDANNLNIELAKIDTSSFPEEYGEQIKFLKEQTIGLESGLREFVNIVDKLKLFLGETQNKRYLLVFQNNTELRASGGFIGSYALIDFKNGKIKNIEIPTGGSYDTEAGLTELVAAPAPLQLVNPLWHFWDANWWPDWPTSARKLMWFYEKSDSPTVDGVISLTPTVLEKILNVIGEIDMSDEYGVVFNDENFWLETQGITEEKLTPEQIMENFNNHPKRIIGDLAEKILAELPARLNNNTLIKLLSVVEESLSEKHVLFYFTDEKLQAEVVNYGWGGKIKDTNWDYLSVINTNIAGGKSDKRMEEVINHTVDIMPNGSIIDSLKIQRTHTGYKNELFCGVRNVDWMRIYVPEGSELLEAQGFKQPDNIYFEEPDLSWEKDPLVYRAETTAKIHEPSNTKIYNENGKTIFANWSMVDPGETITIYLKYRLPFRIEAKEEITGLMEKINKIINPTQKHLYPYAILIQKQPGSIASHINSNLKFPEKFKSIWKYPDNLATVFDGWQINDKLNVDKYWAVLLEINN